MQLTSADHDYHLCGIVPSVILSVDVPTNADGSFYNGEVVDINKDEIFQPSFPLRHATETALSIMNIAIGDGIQEPSEIKPIFCQYTDGGPDHRSTYMSVKLSHIALFCSLDLDMLISCRTAPHQSYRNPAERIMADLNLALQNCALTRSQIEDESIERKIKYTSTLQAARRQAEQNPNIKSALMESVSGSIKIVNERFRRLKRKGVPFRVHEPATNEEMDLLVQSLETIEPGIETKDVIKDVKIDKFPNLKQWMGKHCRFGHYMIQVLLL